MQVLKQVVTPRAIDADWHMPVQTCSFFYRKYLWERLPYPVVFKLAGDHAWVRGQLKAGARFAPVQKPVGIFTWHGDNLSCGDHPDEPELLDPKLKKSAGIKWAKLVYRGRKYLAGGYSRSPVEYEIIRDGQLEKVRIKKTGPAGFAILPTIGRKGRGICSTGFALSGDFVFSSQTQRPKFINVLR